MVGASRRTEGRRAARLAPLLRRSPVVCIGYWQEGNDDADMAEDCVRHALMFFNRTDFNLASAVPGTFALTPHDAMLDALRRDYEAMSNMIFGPIPTIDKVLASIDDLERHLNQKN